MLQLNLMHTEKMEESSNILLPWLLLDHSLPLAAILERYTWEMFFQSANDRTQWTTHDH